MTSSVLVAYATKSGSTREVAEAIADELTRQGATVETRACNDDTDTADYDAVIVGAPILYGKPHEDATRFLHKNADLMSGRPFAAFLTCLELTVTPEESTDAGEVFVDPQLDVPPDDPDRLSYFDRTHLLSTFLDQLLASTPQVAPVSVAVFRGKLDYAELDPVSWLVMRLIRLVYGRAPAGDHRDWSVIRSWAQGLGPQLHLGSAAADPERR